MTNTTSTARIAASALALALAACGTTEKPDRYLEAIPDAAALTLETQGGTATSMALAIDPTPVSSLENDLAVVDAKARALNAALRDTFARLQEIVATGGRELPDQVKVWGPANRCVEPGPDGGACLAEASLRLVVKLFGDRAASFALEARPVDSALPGDFRPVLAGFLVRGEVARRGAGRLWVNLENLKSAAGTGFRGAGYLAAGFAAGPVAKAAGYRMLGFTRDATVHPPVTAAFSGWKSASGVRRVRVAGFADLDETTEPTPMLELGLWRAAWHPTLGGRAFTIVSNFDENGPAEGGLVGNVPVGKYWFARTCYAPGQTTPEYKEWFLCDRLADGSPIQCVVHNDGLGAKEPGVGSESITTWQETSCYVPPELEPEALRPPGLTPPDRADDDGPEDGLGGVGLQPQSVPTTVDDSNPDTTPPT